MAARRKEVVDEERSNETGKLVIADASVGFCEATPIGLVSIYSRRAEDILVQTRDQPRPA